MIATVATIALVAFAQLPVATPSPATTPTPAPAAVPEPTTTAANPIDALMQVALERRKVDWAQFQDYVFRERETVRLVGLGGQVIESRIEEYRRFVRDGHLVRSPDRIDGNPVGEAERQAYEARWLRDELERETAVETPEDQAAAGAGAEGARRERRYFLGFPYEPGNYYLAGRETFAGKEALRIEYYPRHLDPDEPAPGDGARAAGEKAKDGKRRADADDDDDRAMDEALARSLLVTFLVLPDEPQIVRVEIDSIGFDFLPYKWLAKVDRMKASIDLDSPFGPWLPREMRAEARVSVALGTLTLSFRREYFDYARAGIGVEIQYQGVTGSGPAP